MPKRQTVALTTVASEEPCLAWQIRGYNPELAKSKPSPNEDPQGEVAYQRAFADAAKKTPPRIPNPAHYPNSPSAKEYIRLRDEILFSERNMHHDTPSSSKRQPTSPPSLHSPTGSNGRYPSPRDREEPPFTQKPSVVDFTTEPGTHSSPANGYHVLPAPVIPHEGPRPFTTGLPIPLEPKLGGQYGYGPSGPDRMLR